MMIEQNTNYAYKLKYMDNPTFDKVRDLSTKFYRELPQALQDELFEALNRGIDILDSEPQMTAYLFAFGKMHQAKLNYAFGKLPEEFLEQPEINIIDYGCGQALGTMCYADFLREKGYSQKVKTITLIEPSDTCLKRAALHVSVFFPNADIKTANKIFDDLTQDDIVCSEETPTLHILSNVLDMLNFNLEIFAELVKDCLIGYNQFVCVGPYFNYYYKDYQISKFSNMICSEVSYSKVLQKGELNPEKTWTCIVSILSVGKLGKNISTKVTEEDFILGKRDEDCCLYSSDGEKMISYGGIYRDTYRIRFGTIAICDECFFDVYNEIDYFHLRHLYIPESVKIIGNNPFCGSIETIVCDSPYFVVEDDFLLTADKKKIVFYFGQNKKNVNLHNEITIIGSGAFCSSNLSCVSLPSNILEIEDNPFIDAKHWDKDTLVPCVVSSDSNRFPVYKNMLFDSIEKRVISYLGKDSFVVVPEGTKILGKNSFYGAEFNSIFLPDSIEYIDETAFYWCLNLFNNSKGINVSSKSIDKFKEILPHYLSDNLNLLV